MIKAQWTVLDKELHQYRTKTGFIVPSVTQILKAAGLIDTRWYTPTGRDRGTRIHDFVHMMEEMDLDPDLADEEIQPYIAAYQDFRLFTGYTPEHLETGVDYGSRGVVLFAGTVDLCGGLMGVETLLDIKTGSPSPWHPVQVAAYAMAGKVPQIGNLYLRPSGRFGLKIYTEAEAEAAKNEWSRCLKGYWDGSY